ALYQQDVDTLDQIEKVMTAQRFNDSQGPKPEALAAEEARLHRKIRANVEARGELAARNLVSLMNERGTQKAGLMLRASRIPAPAGELGGKGIRHYVFEAPSFQRSARN